MGIIVNFLDRHKLIQRGVVNPFLKGVGVYSVGDFQLKGIIRQIKHQVSQERHPKKLSERPEIVYKKDLMLFLGAIKNYSHRLLFELITHTGLKVSEIVSIKIDDIDFSSTPVTVNGDIRLTDSYLANGLNKTKGKVFLFETTRGTRYSTRRVQQLCSHYSKLSGIKKKITCNTIRKYYYERGGGKSK